MEGRIKKSITKYIGTVFCDENYKDRLEISMKSENDPVTKIDYYISNLIKDEIKTSKKYNHYFFLSEEDLCDLQFPCVILDPIDGTRELSQAIPECAVSLGLFSVPLLESKDNHGWVFNPFTGLEVSSKQALPKFHNYYGGKLLGFVSRSEWKDGIFQNYDSREITLFPRGSIAFKLALLSSGACDFVISLRPKKIWDLAAGTILCSQRGLSFYEDGYKVKSLDKWEYKNPLVWCHDKDFESISRLLKQLNT